MSNKTKAELLEELSAVKPDHGLTDDNTVAEIQDALDNAQGGSESPSGVASPEQNAALEHTAGGATTRDSMDAGVPMTQGDGAKRTGPEDALGDVDTRGDYSDRTVRGPHATTEVIPDGERRHLAEKIAKGSDGTLTVDQALGDVPRTRLVAQTPAPQAA
jgi:hypothetical protein